MFRVKFATSTKPVAVADLLNDQWGTLEKAAWFVPYRDSPIRHIAATETGLLYLIDTQGKAHPVDLEVAYAVR